jgi:hypothetical protein
MTLRTTAVALVVLVWASQALAWNSLGHKVVAEIAGLTRGVDSVSPSCTMRRY